MAVQEMKNAMPTASRADAAVTQIQGHRFLNLTTFRKNGVPVVTTLLFAQANGKIYVWTAKESGKVKRIRHNAMVQIAPSTRLGRPLGLSAAATARILSATEQREVQPLMDHKYGWLKTFFELVWRLLRHEEVYVELTPVAP